jgi:hypothetical protein
MTSRPALLRDLGTPPKTGTSWLYRWADYAELRCLVHRDCRFSRDNFAEALQEAQDQNHDGEASAALDDKDEDAAAELPAPAEDGPAERDDRHEALAARCFQQQLALRAEVFGVDWPFTLSADTQELTLRSGERTPAQWLYLQLLLSASLQYCNPRRRRELTGPFEGVSLEVFKRLMPAGAEVHAFGATHNSRYTGHLFDRLESLVRDLRGHLRLQREHFSTHDAGDGGVDLVAWHPMGDTRDRLPVALAQCGCTADGWPSKSAEASPDRLSGNLHLPSSWATYYFMPLDLTMSLNAGVDWQRKSDMSTAIVVDRLRMLRLADPAAMHAAGLLQSALVNEAAAMQMT